MFIATNDDLDDSDKSSIMAEPYGASRSNTLDCKHLESELMGESPTRHLANLTDAMMQKLPDRVQAVTPVSVTGPTPPSSYLLSAEVKELKGECPRLWKIRLSPQVKIIDLA